MQLSRSRKAVLLGVLVLAVAVTGRASANTTRSQPGAVPVAAPSPSAPPPPAPSAKPADPPASPPPAAKKPPGKKPPGKKVTQVKTGPAGSRMFTGSKAVALTFDDGPDPVQTPRILELLAKHKVKATFCLVGTQAKRHPHLVKRIAAEGHTLCNHTWDHSLTLGKAPVPKIREDLARTNAVIRKAVPNASIKYFRAPGGNFTPRFVAVAKQQGMISIYWKVDPQDWRHGKGDTGKVHQQKLVWRVCKFTRPGSIVLSHDFGQPDTIEAYRKILPYLKSRYQLAALPR